MTVKNVLKHNRHIYTVYYYLFSAILRFIGLFVRVDNDLVLFVSYGGKKYDDSPRFVYQYLKNHPEYSRLKMVWAFKSPDNFPDVERKIKIDTLAYFLTALKAKYWITNASCARGLSFKKSVTVNALFLHGMNGIKKIGADIEKKEKTYIQHFTEKFDYIFMEGKEEADILIGAWGVDKSQLYLTGLPRNDDLAYSSPDEIDCIKKRIGIPADKNVILYAPTFREENVDSNLSNVLGIPFDLEKWELELSDKYVFLIEAHYEVDHLTDAIPAGRFAFNVSSYPVLNDLLKITDILITDYSSIAFDYAILEKPIFCYGYDYDQYMANRGTYNDLNTLFNHGVIRSEDELLHQIKNIDYAAECSYTKEKIKDRFMASYGDATEKAVSIIFPKK